MGRGRQTITAAKMTRSERAITAYTGAMNGERIKRGGYSRKGNRRQMKARYESYDKLMYVAEAIGVKVRRMTEKEITQERKTVSGKTFTAGGFFQAPDVIALAYESPDVLAHELAHAVDYQLDWRRGTGDKETLATAVQTMLMAELGCAVRPRHVDYAKDQGGSIKTLEDNEERIRIIYDLIMETIQNRPVEIPVESNFVL